MSLFTYNEEDVQTASGKTITYAGIYNVEIVKAEYSVSKNSGREMFALDYRVLDGTESGNMIYSDYYVDDSDDIKKNPTKKYFSYKKINSLLKALGGLKSGTVFELKNVGQTLVGKRIGITVNWKKNEYNGKVTYRTNVSDVHAMGTESQPDLNKPRPEAKPDGATNGQGTNPFGNPSEAPAFGASAVPDDNDDPFNGTDNFGTNPFNN